MFGRSFDLSHAILAAKEYGCFSQTTRDLWCTQGRNPLSIDELHDLSDRNRSSPQMWCEADSV